MRFDIPQIIFSKIIRAIVEFDLINDGDKILIGISGGKDSLFLVYALEIIRRRMKKRFKLFGLTIDPQFTADFGEKIHGVKNFCAELGIEHHFKTVDIASLINDKSTCYTCSYFRRAAINRIANELGANKIAYAHHLDDAVETFFMSLLSSGQLTTFQPKTYLDKTDLTVIRPLIYVREAEIIDFTKEFPVLKSPCPFDGNTNRQRIKNLIRELEADFPDLFSHLAAAMRKNSIGELWDAPKTRKEMRDNYFALKFGGNYV